MPYQAASVPERVALQILILAEGSAVGEEIFSMDGPILRPIGSGD
jgi:hypothetical protein